MLIYFFVQYLNHLENLLASSSYANVYQQQKN